MQDPRPPDQSPEGPAAERRLIERWRQMQTEWRQALKEGAAPDPEAFLAAGLETAWASLRRELELIAQAERPPQGNAGSDATGSFHQSGETQEQRSKAGGTSTPADPERNTETREYVPAAAGASTVDAVESDQETGQQTTGAVSTPGAGKARARPGAPAGYEILKVLGRGAMGVVYKARQPGLKRVVALKMILAGDHADGGELARFRTEAEAVAQLQHANIVQVYEVGAQDGRPFLTLEYVDGGSLKEKLGGKPQPVRPAAQLVQLLAEAMHFAHGRNVIHRDLKPGNVLLTAPQPAGGSRSVLHAHSLAEEVYGTPKIADFGLAKRLEEDSSQTRSGTILGTPSYMAPEQAAGDVKHVGPSADQYALGAILYELLTGRPPFQGTTLWETIDQVCTQEPIPPSRLQPKVPRDLETICLKCLQKEPPKRYADAAALAEDLRRFVANEPILARPVSARERLWRWCRRNPWVAGPSAAALGLLLALLAGLAVYNVKLRDFNAQLTEEQEQTEKQRVAAVEAKGIAEKAEGEAKESAKVALQQRGLALTALGHMVSNVQAELSKQPGLHDLQKKLLDIALKDLRDVAKNAAAKVSLTDSTEAAAHFNLGRLFTQLGDTAAAAMEFRQAEAIYAVLTQAAPDHPDARANQINRVNTLLQLGFVSLRLQGQAGEAAAHFRKAAELLAPLEEHRPGDKFEPTRIKQMRAAVLDRLGIITIDASPREARDHYQAALDLRRQLAEILKTDEARGELAGSYVLVGGADFRLRNPGTTEKYYLKAVEIRAGLAKAHPGDRGRQREYAFTRQRLGDFYLRTSRPDLAAKEYDTAARIYQGLVDKDPKQVDFQDRLAQTLSDIATAALRQGNKALAAQKYRAALALREERARKSGDLAVKKDLMASLARCGEHCRAAEIAETVWKTAPEDRGTLYDVACCFALCAGALAPDKDGARRSAEECRLREHYADRAVQALRAAVAHGHRDVVWTETEPDFDAIHDRPDFKAALAELARAAAP
jgi:serine/threonine-protein kinase